MRIGKGCWKRLPAESERLSCIHRQHAVVQEPRVLGPSRAPLAKKGRQLRMSVHEFDDETAVMLQRSDLQAKSQVTD